MNRSVVAALHPPVMVPLAEHGTNGIDLETKIEIDMRIVIGIDDVVIHTEHTTDAHTRLGTHWATGTSLDQDGSIPIEEHGGTAANKEMRTSYLSR